MTPERRGAPRRGLHAGEPLAHARLRGGRELTLADVSSGGALADGAARLLPGTHADVHLNAAQGRVLVRCRIVRVTVSSLSATDIRYRAALAFERAVDVG